MNPSDAGLPGWSAILKLPVPVRAERQATNCREKKQVDQ
jgi:hypothetical protein